ncbi:hypothetical protein OEZ86_000511 [Tetradesmus obliquus]|nr:hypothetical protein OEZ86_000511 [Tetradesmus obliquus]
MRGWVAAGTGTSCDGSNPSDTALVAYCPAAGCPARAPETTCRQVNAKEGVGLRRWPCHDDAYVPPGGGGNNTIITYLTRGQSVIYSNTDSKQTSVCGKQPDPGVKALCWIAVKTATGVEGFIPAARGDFADAFCSPAPSTDTESLVTQPCAGELYAECRQVTAANGLDVYASPCGDIVSPPVHIPRCGTFEYIVGKKVTESCSGGPSCWAMVRYRDEAQWLQLGWVQISSGECSSAGTADVAECGAAACLSTGTACRQVTSSGVTMRAQPCKGAPPVATLKMNAMFEYWGPDYKISSTCSAVTGSNSYDGFCWVKATYGGAIGWLPAAYIGTQVTSAFCDHSGTGESYVRYFCDRCASVRCQQKECYKARLCNPATGICSPWKAAQAGTPCKAQPDGKCNGSGQCKTPAVAPGCSTVTCAACEECKYNFKTGAKCQPSKQAVSQSCPSSSLLGGLVGLCSRKGASNICVSPADESAVRKLWTKLVEDPDVSGYRVQSAIDGLTRAEQLELYKLLYDWPSGTTPPSQGSASQTLKALESRIEAQGDNVMEDLTALRVLRIRIDQMLAIASVLSKAGQELPSGVKLNMEVFSRFINTGKAPPSVKVPKEAWYHGWNSKPGDPPLGDPPQVEIPCCEVSNCECMLDFMEADPSNRKVVYAKFFKTPAVSNLLDIVNGLFPCKTCYDCALRNLAAGIVDHQADCTDSAYEKLLEKAADIVFYTELRREGNFVGAMKDCIRMGYNVGVFRSILLNEIAEQQEHSGLVETHFGSGVSVCQEAGLGIYQTLDEVLGVAAMLLPQFRGASLAFAAAKLTVAGILEFVKAASKVIAPPNYKAAAIQAATTNCRGTITRRCY